MDLLQYISQFLKKIKNIFICPQFIAESSGSGFYLLNFSTKETYLPEQIFLAFMRWLFGCNTNFSICLDLEEMPYNMPIYLQ